MLEKAQPSNRHLLPRPRLSSLQAAVQNHKCPPESGTWEHCLITVQMGAVSKQHPRLVLYFILKKKNLSGVQEGSVCQGEHLISFFLPASPLLLSQNGSSRLICLENPQVEMFIDISPPCNSVYRDHGKCIHSKFRLMSTY